MAHNKNNCRHLTLLVFRKFNGEKFNYEINCVNCLDNLEDRFTVTANKENEV